jgi:hypothetical protein
MGGLCRFAPLEIRNSKYFAREARIASSGDCAVESLHTVARKLWLRISDFEFICPLRIEWHLPPSRLRR